MNRLIKFSLLAFIIMISLSLKSDLFATVQVHLNFEDNYQELTSNNININEPDIARLIEASSDYESKRLRSDIYSKEDIQVCFLLHLAVGDKRWDSFYNFSYTIDSIKKFGIMNVYWALLQGKTQKGDKWYFRASDAEYISQYGKRDAGATLVLYKYIGAKYWEARRDQTQYVVQYGLSNVRFTLQIFKAFKDKVNWSSRAELAKYAQSYGEPKAFKAFKIALKEVKMFPFLGDSNSRLDEILNGLDWDSL
ncbi:MAG: hypothetical protein HOE90_20345 [Bacteriovoracaceae bacterium]|jgi:hypothetical protein|nr:hypothetical protein [Bacteriovoracaceae bacterium]